MSEYGQAFLYEYGQSCYIHEYGLYIYIFAYIYLHNIVYVCQCMYMCGYMCVNMIVSCVSIHMCIYTVVVYLYFMTVQRCEYTVCEFMQNVLYKLDLIIITRVPMCG